MQHELEQLTKELRQVNLQQFIKQTGTKVTVLPAEPAEDEGTANASRSIGTTFDTGHWTLLRLYEWGGFETQSLSL